MTGEKFAEIVTKRANERVQSKLCTFKTAISNAFIQLTGSASLYKRAEKDINLATQDDSANRHILQQMLNTDTIKFREKWPAIIWRQEEDAVTKELLGMMDEMQKALIAAGPKEGECTTE